MKLTTPCIEFQGFRDAAGYGMVGSKRAHRTAFQLATGIDPTGLLVCHHCDNPPCINPEHLYLGTHQDNANDKVARNRCKPMPGSQNPAATIDEEIAQKIIDTPGTYRDVAKQFNVGYGVVRNAKRGDTWKHLDRTNVKTSRIIAKLTPEQATAIRQDPRDAVAVARDYGVSQGAILKIRKRVTYKYCP